MKAKISLLLLAAMAVTLIGGCGSTVNNNSSVNNSGSTQENLTNNTNNRTDDSAANNSDSPANNSSESITNDSTTDNNIASNNNTTDNNIVSNNDIFPDNGYAEGYMGDSMHTAWFNYIINSAYITNEFEGYTPSAGNELLVVDITVESTFNESIPMFLSDFQAQWNDTADDAYRWPVEDLDYLRSDILPNEYTLGVNETRTGLLLYEVPSGNDDFSISFVEYYANDTTGDTFFVFFTADDRR